MATRLWTVVATLALVLGEATGATTTANSTESSTNTSNNVVVVSSDKPETSTVYPTAVYLAPTSTPLPDHSPSNSEEKVVKQIVVLPSAGLANSSVVYENWTPTVFYERDATTEAPRARPKGNPNSSVNYDEDEEEEDEEEVPKKSIPDGPFGYEMKRVGFSQTGKPVFVLVKKPPVSWRTANTRPVYINGQRMQLVSRNRNLKQKKKKKIPKQVMVIAESVHEDRDVGERTTRHKLVEDVEEDDEFEEEDRRVSKKKRPSKALYQSPVGMRDLYPIPTPPPMPGMPMVANVYWRKIVYPQMPSMPPLESDLAPKQTTTTTDLSSSSSLALGSTDPKPEKKVEKYIVYYVKKNGSQSGTPQVLSSNSPQLKGILRQLKQMKPEHRKEVEEELIEIGDTYHSKTVAKAPMLVRAVYRSKNRKPKSSGYMQSSSDLTIIRRSDNSEDDPGKNPTTHRRNGHKMSKHYRREKEKSHQYVSVVKSDYEDDQ